MASIGFARAGATCTIRFRRDCHMCFALLGSLAFGNIWDAVHLCWPCSVSETQKHSSKVFGLPLL